MTELEALLEDRALVFLCAVSRISGFVAVAPLPWTVAPIRVRAALVALLSLVACASPIELAHGLPQKPLVVALAVVSEVGIGACIAMAVRLVVAAVEIAAEFIAPQLGLGVAHLFDPHAHVSETPLGTMFRHLAILLAVIVGVHRQVLVALFGSFEVLPLGELSNPGRTGAAMLALTTQSVEAGVRIALPTVAVLFMVQIALAFIARAAPALQIFSVGFAVTVGVGILVLVLSLPDTARIVLVEMSHLDVRIQALVGALLGGSP